MAGEILQRVVSGESWTEVFLDKRGDVISIVATNTPLYDDEGNLVGDICTSVDAKNFEEAKSLLSIRRDYENYPTSSRTNRTASAEEQVAITSKISDLDSKVSNKGKSKMTPEECCSDPECGRWDDSTNIKKVDTDVNSLDCVVLWEDLTIGDQIGQGSCGTVYHALWNGSDVAVKVFFKKEYSDDLISSFRQEVLKTPTFGWNFITFHGSPPVYYGRTKEAFRVAKPSLDESRKDNSCCFSSNINCIETNGCRIMPSTFLGTFELYLFMYGND